MPLPLVTVSRDLSRDVDRLRFAEPVTHVYNPLTYARAPHERYLERWGNEPKQAIFLGMNPGPFGMAQTGVPFGDVSSVRDFLGVTGEVIKPAQEHPKRRIEGFACGRSEVSGTRFWGWVKTRFEKPERFFERFFVVNYCPLVFMEASARNVTPDKLPKAEREPLFVVCDHALGRIVDALAPGLVIGVGAFAEARARAALGDRAISFGSILHPSPASPAANRGWAPQIERQLRALGVSL